MSASARALAVLPLSLALASCVSFKVRAPSPNDNHLELIEICRGVKETDGILAPQEPCAEFTGGDSPVYCLIRVRNVSGTVELRWKWYAPDGKLSRDTGGVSVSETQMELYSVTAYDVLRADGGTRARGEWTVAVFVNDVLAGLSKFRITEADAEMRNTGWPFRFSRGDDLPALAGFAGQRVLETAGG